MPTMTNEHVFIKHTIVNVEVPGVDEDGLPVVVVDPDEQEIGEQNSVYGCIVCNKSLQEALEDVVCPGTDISPEDIIL